MAEDVTTVQELTRREAAKLRTRQRLLAAARALAGAGEDISVARVAQHAGISTATAYRYYSDVPTLMMDAAMELRLDESRRDELAEFEARVRGVADPLERLLIAQRQMLDDARRNETEYRLFVAKSQERHVHDQALGEQRAPGGRTRALIEAALGNLKERMGAPRYRDLVLTLTLVMGPEAFLTLSDLAGLRGRELSEINETAVRDIYVAHVARSDEA